MRRKGLAANSFLLNSRQSPKTDQYIDQYGFSVDGPIFKNKTFFLFVGEKYREGTPAPLNSTTPTQAMKNGDFSGLRDAQGRPIIIFDPNTGRDVNGVWIRDPFPGNRIPADRISATARAIMKYYPDPNYTTAGAAPWQNNLDYPEHFNKDLFWNWVGKVDHNFSPNDRVFFRWGENERNEVRNTTAIRSGAAQDGQLPLWRANRALVADWVRVFGAGTVFNLRGSYTYFLDWSYSQDALGFDATEFWPSSLVGQMPSQAVDGIFPRVELTDFVEPVARLGSEPEPKLHDSAERVDDPRRPQHPQRSRPAVDQRLSRELQQFWRAPAVQPAIYAEHPEQHERARRQFFRLVPARCAGRRPGGCQPHAPLQVVLRGPVDPGRLATQQQVDPEPRLPLGLQRLRSTEEDNMLNYAFDPTLVNPVSARVGQQVLGGIRFAGVDGAPDKPWKYDKNNYQFRVGTAYSINDKTVLRARLGQVLPQPDQSVVQRRVLPEHADHHVARRRPDADLCAEQPVAERDPVPARKRARSAHVPWAQSKLLEH